MNMKKYNLNEYMYIQITDSGFDYLQKTVGPDYITHCIMNRESIIDGQKWYKLQCHQVFDLFPINYGGKSYILSNVMFDDNSLK